MIWGTIHNTSTAHVHERHFLLVFKNTSSCSCRAFNMLLVQSGPKKCIHSLLIIKSVCAICWAKIIRAPVPSVEKTLYYTLTLKKKFHLNLFQRYWWVKSVYIFLGHSVYTLSNTHSSWLPRSQALWYESGLIVILFRNMPLAPRNATSNISGSSWCQARSEPDISRL